MHRNNTSELSAIILSCSQNNRVSQNALYKRYFAYGMSIANRYADSEKEALTILNDSFLKVFNNLNKFDLTKPYKPWFRKIVVNTAINHLKSKKKYQKEVNLVEAENIFQDYNVESQISYKELINTLQYLSAAYRNVFNLYVLDGFKHREIAELLDISISTSKSNLTRAKQKLRVLVTKKFNDKNIYDSRL